MKNAMKRIIKGMPALTEKSNVSARFRNRIVQDCNEEFGNNIAELRGYRRVGNQSFVGTYVDEYGEELYALVEITVTKNYPVQKIKEEIQWF